jgi:hypothetical protein
MPLEIVVGRWLALCVHPTSAWRVLPRSGRSLLFASYMGASYFAVLMILLIL